MEQKNKVRQDLFSFKQNAYLMPLKLKILTLALLPLLLVTIIITLINIKQSQSLSELEIQTFEENLLASKRNELKNYVSLALTAVSQVTSSPWKRDFEAKEEVKRILNGLTYGEDGYFFVYDGQGVNLVHPAQPELVGQNLINMQDENGTFVFRDLLAVAKQGGGFHRYVWRKPSKGDNEDKLSYVVLLPEWGWMLGTGLYVDDIAKEVARARQEVTENIRNTFFTVLVIMAVTTIIIVMIGIAINVHESRLADARLRHLAHKSVQFQVSQRRRFARELHDGINQLMVSVKFRVELAINKMKKGDCSAAVDLEKGMDVLNQAIQEVRLISHDLRPSLLDDMGLTSALRSLLHEYEARTGIIVETELNFPEERLPDDIEITLYRVIQEALTNVDKHSGADEVRLKTWVQGRYAWVTLKDNGEGFDVVNQVQSNGIGLRNMHDRIELLSGEFVLTSDIGHGTQLRVKLPLV
ncbi:two-component system, NarL family, sensor kinase [Neptunomonas antarctica]|uniref:Two-component system, NarL family, sensor kinase n=2 Tax=Neptunomonas antarctica TaxID=619304 RepID=A0A1N7M8F3_9GAMM|nr:two-component system, NarL family, sensor kinase [Neptunomonas antarctica]